MVSVARQFEAPVKIVSLGKWGRSGGKGREEKERKGRGKWGKCWWEMTDDFLTWLLNFLIGLSKELLDCHQCLFGRWSNSKMAIDFVRFGRYCYSR